MYYNRVRVCTEAAEIAPGSQVVQSEPLGPSEQRICIAYHY